jgi:L-alanine-DL-glutamate epimerase-like enolase superfamily enzyme
VVIRLETDDGAVGWGESCAGADTESVVAAVKAMSTFAIGRSCWDAAWGVPDAPGLGVEVDEERLQEAAARYARYGQFQPFQLDEMSVRWKTGGGERA